MRPGTTEETAALLALCSELGVVVVPFGGGTSVVGGLAGMDPDDCPAISVDLSRMASVQSIDVPSSCHRRPRHARPGAGGGAVPRGLTFGHLPQSWEFGDDRRLPRHPLGGPVPPAWGGSTSWSPP